MSSLGFGFTIISIFFNGSYAAPYKLAARKVKLDPIVFLLYTAVGIFLSSWISQAFLFLNPQIVPGGSSTFHISPYGLLAGIIITVSISSSFFAVEFLGLAMAQGIFSGFALLTSFLWGFQLDGIPSSLLLSFVGVGLICIGVIGISLCQNIDQYLRDKSCCPCHQTGEKISSMGDPLINFHTVAKLSDINEEFCDEEKQQSRESSRTSMKSKSMSENPSFASSIAISSITMTDFGTQTASVSPESPSVASIVSRGARGSYLLGIFWAMLCGILGGSFLVPLHYAPTSQQGLVFLPGFGIGSMVTAPLLFALRFVTKGSAPAFHIPKTGALGVIAGVVWNINNAFSIAAIPLIGFSLAIPLAQCAIIVSGLWGIFYFKELQGSVIAVVFIFAVILIAGAVLLALGRS